MRGVVSLLMLGVGIALAVVSYFFLAAPLGQATGPAFSNPRLLGAPTIFVLGVVLVFLSAVAYELIPDRQASEAAEVSRARRAPQGAAEAAMGGAAASSRLAASD